MGGVLMILAAIGVPQIKWKQVLVQSRPVPRKSA